MPTKAFLYLGLENVSSITINGIHIAATIDGQPTDVRGGRTLGDDWYDEDHAKFAEGMRALDRMLKAKGAK